MLLVESVVLVLRMDIKQAYGIIGLVQDLQYLIIPLLPEPLLRELRRQVPASRRNRVPWIEYTVLIKCEVFGLLLGLRLRLVRVLIVAADHLVVNEATF